MREILFRAKDTHSGAWHYGDLISLRKEGYCGIAEHTLVDNKHLCDITTLGQYTGQTDCTNRKIFEGDIVKYGDTIHKVVFEQRAGTAYFGLVYSEIETLPFGHYQDLRHIKVIGNIYDNPDLLEGGDDV